MAMVVPTIPIQVQLAIIDRETTRNLGEPPFLDKPRCSLKHFNMQLEKVRKKWHAETCFLDCSRLAALVQLKSRTSWKADSSSNQRKSGNNGNNSTKERNGKSCKQLGRPGKQKQKPIITRPRSCKSDIVWVGSRMITEQVLSFLGWSLKILHLGSFGCFLQRGYPQIPNHLSH